MKIIRKNNYNFYDTECKTYMSSKDIMELISANEPFQVVDAKTRVDITEGAISNALRNHYKGNVEVDAILLKLFKESV